MRTDASYCFESAFKKPRGRCGPLGQMMVDHLVSILEERRGLKGQISGRISMRSPGHDDPARYDVNSGTARCEELGISPGEWRSSTSL